MKAGTQRVLAAAAILCACGRPGGPEGAGIWPREFGRGTRRAQAALSVGRRDEAAAVVAALTVPEDAPPAARAGMLLARARLKDDLRDFAGEEADARAALALRPGGFDELACLTQFLRDRGRLDESLALAGRLAATTEPVAPFNRAERWLQRAETLNRMGRTAEAEADVRRALEAKPDDVPSLWLGAQILLRAGRAAEALPYAERMLAAARGAGERARAYSQRAQVRGALGDKAGAAADAEAAVRADPRDLAALESAMEAAQAAGRPGEALAFADRAVAAAAPAPQKAVALQQRARLKRARGDRAGAEADLRAALAAQPDAEPVRRELEELRRGGGGR